MTDRCPHCQCKLESGYHEPWCEVRAPKVGTACPERLVATMLLDCATLDIACPDCGAAVGENCPQREGLN